MSKDPESIFIHSTVSSITRKSFIFYLHVVPPPPKKNFNQIFLAFCTFEFSTEFSNIVDTVNMSVNNTFIFPLFSTIINMQVYTQEILQFFTPSYQTQCYLKYRKTIPSSLSWRCSTLWRLHLCLCLHWSASLPFPTNRTPTITQQEAKLHVYHSLFKTQNKQPFDRK